MPQAKRKPTPAEERFEEAADLLPQFEPKMKGIERWWQVGATIPDLANPAEHDRVLANYTLDCDLGASLGDNFVKVLRRYPDQAYELTEFTLKALAKVGRYSGVEVAFLDRIAALVASGIRATTPVSLVKPAS